MENHNINQKQNEDNTNKENKFKINKDKLKIDKSKIKFITKDSLKDFGMWVLVSVALFLVLEYLSRKSRIEKLQLFLNDNIRSVFINVMLILGITGIIFLFKHKKAMLWIISFIFLALGIVSRMVLEFRGMPVAFMDIYAINDGMSIASKFINTKMLIIAAVVLILFLIGTVFLWKMDKNSKRLNGVSNIVAWLISIVAFAVSIGPIKEKS